MVQKISNSNNVGEIEESIKRTLQKEISEKDLSNSKQNIKDDSKLNISVENKPKASKEVETLNLMANAKDLENRTHCLNTRS